MNHEYQPVEDAFREGTVESASTEELQNYLLALSNQPIPNEMVRHRDIIRSITINHMLLQRHVGILQNHITQLNESNGKLQKWVIALAVAALVTAGTQVGLQLEARLQTPASQPPASVVQSESPSPSVAPSSDPASEKIP
ncbi:MAG: hypothetical protein V7717_02775 [Porticoccaceae bacterium]